MLVMAELTEDDLALAASIVRAEGYKMKRSCIHVQGDRCLKIAEVFCSVREVTKDETGALLAALLDERTRLQKFIDRRRVQVGYVESEVLAGLDFLDRLVATLKGG